LTKNSYFEATIDAAIGGIDRGNEEAGVGRIHRRRLFQWAQYPASEPVAPTPINKNNSNYERYKEIL